MTESNPVEDALKWASHPNIARLSKQDRIFKDLQILSLEVIRLRSLAKKMAGALESITDDIRSTNICLTHCDKKQLSRVQGPHWDYIIMRLGESTEIGDALLSLPETKELTNGLKLAP